MATAKDVAEWMKAEVDKRGELLQTDAATHIERHFGGDFVEQSIGGGRGIRIGFAYSVGLVIRKDVLRQFRKITDKTVVWDRTLRLWRRRRPKDAPSRRQDY